MRELIVVPGSVAGITRVEEIATVVEDSATNAARAARLDPAWNALSRATSDLSDVYAYAATLPLDGGGRVDLGRAPKAKVDELRALLEDEAEWSATIRAECRKATA